VIDDVAEVTELVAQDRPAPFGQGVIATLCRLPVGRLIGGVPFFDQAAFLEALDRLVER